MRRGVTATFEEVIVHFQIEMAAFCTSQKVYQADVYATAQSPGCQPFNLHSRVRHWPKKT